MSTFVLVHGSWHDGSAWEPVRAHLAEKGHRAFSPTIAGHGKGVDKNVNHAQCTQSIIDFILEKDLHDIVLLGHIARHEAVLCLGPAQEFPELHGRHRPAAGGMGLASTHVKPPGAVSTGANAGQS